MPQQNGKRMCSNFGAARRCDIIRAREMITPSLTIGIEADTMPLRAPPGTKMGPRRRVHDITKGRMMLQWG